MVLVRGRDFQIRLLIEYEKRAGTPAYQCLAAALQSCIEMGRLAAGDALPSTRELATDLGLARQTVVRAYNELASRALVRTTSTRGTFVLSPPHDLAPPGEMPLTAAAKPNFEPISEYSRRLLSVQGLHATTGHLSQLNYGAPPSKLLPVRRWTKLVLEQSSRTLDYVYEPAVFGAPVLRQSIARYLFRTKGIACSASQIVLFSETQSALNLLCRTLLNENDGIAIEEPGYGGVKNVAVAQKLQISTLPVDHEGCQTDRLQQLKSVRCVYITPSHQDPTGVSLSPSRRQKLLAWATRSQSWIVEDDYDGDLSYGVTRQRPLAAMNSDRVIYVSSFWKALYPLTSLGFIVLPASLIELVASAKSISEPTAQSVEHLALAEFIDQGYLEKQWRKLKLVYQKQRSMLLHHLKQKFRELIFIPKDSAGTHQLIRLDVPQSPERICALAAAAGLGLEVSSGYYLGPSQPMEFLIDFSNLKEDTTVESIERFWKDLMLEK